MLPLIVPNISFDLVVEHGMGHTSVVIVERREEGLVCVQWKDRGNQYDTYLGLST
jgi:hypothetical protein